MIALETGTLSRLQARALVARTLVWFTVRRRDDGAAYSEGYWNDVGTVAVTVRLPRTGGTAIRTYGSHGGLLEVPPIPRVSAGGVQTVTLRLSQVADQVNDLLRFWEPRQGRVEIHRLLLSPSTRLPAANAYPRFLGWIDRIEFDTPAEGGEGGVSVICTSDAQELTRSNPSRRSDADQRRRASTDNFFADAGTAGQLPVFWGTKKA